MTATLSPMAGSTKRVATRTDLLLHPVRLRIVQVFLNDRRLTVADVAARLDDVPLPSLYRHISLLHQGKLLEVVGERQARGATERTYRLVQGAASLGSSEGQPLTNDQLRRGLQTALVGLLADFDRFLAQRKAKRLGGIRQAVLSLSPDEANAFAEQLGEFLAPWIDAPSTPDRQRYNLTLGFLPAQD